MSPTARRELRDYNARQRRNWLMKAPWYVRAWRWLWT
jgi:hypothetical protein